MLVVLLFAGLVYNNIPLIDKEIKTLEEKNAKNTLDKVYTITQDVALIMKRYKEDNLKYKKAKSAIV